MTCMSAGTSPTGAPVFLFRPGLAVSPSGGSTWRRRCRYATSRPPPDQRPGTTHGHQRPTRETPGPCAAAPHPPLRPPRQARSRRRRHGLVHQLFCHLRHAEHCALRDGVSGSDLGHVDHLLRERPEDFHQLAHHLRHRNVERRDGHKRLQHGLHGALRNPFLWPRRLYQASLPPGSSSYRLKSSGWGGGVFQNFAVWFNSLSSSPALAIFWPHGAVWCFISARAIATVIRSRRSHERSRRCRRLIAPPAPCSSLPRNDHVKSITRKGDTETRATLERRLVLLLLS